MQLNTYVWFFSMVSSFLICMVMPMILSSSRMLLVIMLLVLL
jgi:hypothetical protein